jgi:ectoine hydroxylase
MKTTDNYPTRKTNTSRFIIRNEPIIYTNIENDFYHENGYLIKRNFFNTSDLDLILKDQHVGFVTNEPNSKEIRSRTGVHKDINIKKLSQNKDLISLVESILGKSIYIHQSRINYKEAVSGSGWSWHSDFETWHSQDGMPNMRCLSAMIPLTENNIYNGSLMVIPGSHKMFYSCKKEMQYSAEENFADQKEGVPDKEAIIQFYKMSENKIEIILCNPGDLILFDCNLLHVSTQNLSPKNRTNLFFVYNHESNKLVDPFSYEHPRPNEMGERENIEIIKS